MSSPHPAARLSLLLSVLLASIAAAGQSVLELRVRDTIQPVTAAYIERGLRQAATEHADAVVLEISTPGGLLDSTRDIVQSIESSHVPVIVYVAPAGSRAASAGFFILEAADVAAMAPGTNAGAAHPVFGAGPQPDPVMKDKIENDAAAFLRSYVERRGHNAQAAEDAVRGSKAYSADEAQRLHLVDFIAPDVPSLLAQLDQHAIKRFDGTTSVVHTRNAAVHFFPPSTRERLLTRLVDPNLAVLLLSAGLMLIYLEFNIPGTIIPGSLGVLLVLLALFGLNLLPLRYSAIALLVAAIALIVLEAKYGGHGLLGLAGVAAMFFGLFTLVDAPIAEQRVHLATAAAVGITFGGITLFLAIIAMRARRMKVRTGMEALIHQEASTITPLEPAGQVVIDGAIWSATSSEPVPAGVHVRVVGYEGLKLLVSRR